MSARAHDRNSKQRAHVVPKTVFLLDQVNLNADDEKEDDSQNDEYTM